MTTAKQDKQAQPEIVIVGFPKCGTSALFRALEDNEDIFALRAENGHMELPWPQIKNVTTETPKGKIRLHKLPGYIYNEAALEYLVTSNPDSLLVVCIRDPQKALVSWWNMHRKIARSKTPSKHFAYVEREFYANCGVNEYYERSAKSRLDYGPRVKSLTDLAGPERVAVISQERMAHDLSSITDYLLRIAEGQRPPSPEETVTGIPHRGYADKTSVNIAPRIVRSLSAKKENLYKTVANCHAYCAL